MLYNYEEEQLLTLNEFADELQISSSFAYELLNSGKIKGIKLGKIWRIPRSSIAEFITNNISK